MAADTIAAISTAPGRGAIAVVRLSGTESVEIADRLFKGKEGLARSRSHSVRYGRLTDCSGQVLDEVLVTVMKAPDTYTGEDVVEISCHGGSFVSELVLKALVEAGCRLAEPGEFTKRAFLNGRIDLAQAEAVAELVAARTRKALDGALRQLEGRLSEGIAQVRASLVNVLAEVEARIDFPDDVPEALEIASLCQTLHQCSRSLGAIVSERAASKLFSAGVRMPIIGRPNVGKSSLLNAMIGHSRAIVTPCPGTTRDTIEQEVELEGIPVRLVDTAGLRSASEEVEEEGVRRSLEQLRIAEIVILVVDASSSSHGPDVEILKAIGETPCAVAINKIDIASAEPARAALGSCSASNSHTFTEISATQGLGIASLKEAVVAQLKRGEVEPHEAACASQRHLDCLRAALQNIESAKATLDSGGFEELVALELREAAEQLGLITGESVGPDILESIFARFCVGK